jgi:uncharacterized circularly permuted ATP-grasp superfamily protein/uncharacterized alpha-E superfamily protein
MAPNESGATVALSGALPPFDEMVDGRGHVRPHWRSVIGAFAGMPPAELLARAARLDRAFADEGIATALAQDPGRPPETLPWRCDPVPLPITAGEWARLESGLVQRAQAIEACLADLYGPQRLLAEGIVPPALVWPNPNFLRACRTLPPGPRRLGFYAADLIRGRDGVWRVLADRTNAPHGIGFARENRRMLARVMPEAFRATQVRQLRPFFEAWEDFLRRQAPPGRGNPRLVILAGGATDPFFVEHLFLARELSATLTEASDLSARGDRLYLKTLRGLQGVDVVLRRIFGPASDPLELEAGSHVGVPGLLQVMRTGGVVVSNDPGTGLAESPALSAFLPAICETLLGARLVLPGVETLWLGDPGCLAVLKAAPEKFLLRPARDGTRPATALAELSDAALAAMMQRVAAEPWAYAATQAFAPSGAPSVTDDGLAPKPVVLRAFLVPSADHGWHVMPGGLARVIDDADRLAGRLPRSGVSKDVWVLSDEGIDIVGPSQAPAPALTVRRQPSDLPSRLLDNLYWLGRYVERLEVGARLLRAALARLMRAPMLPRDHAQLRALAYCLAEAQLVESDAAHAPPGTRALAAALLDSCRTDRPMLQLFSDIERLASSVRDRITADMWAGLSTELGHARETVRKACDGPDELLAATAGTIRFSTYIAGMAAENMVRGGARLFLDLGRRIERGSAIARDIAHALDGPPQRMEAGLALALELADSQITYRTRYLAVLQPLPALDLVLADPANPRGLSFQFHAAAEALSEAAQDRSDTLVLEARMLATLAAAAAAELPPGQEGFTAAVRLPDALRRIEARTAALSDAIARRYFSHVAPHQQVGLGEGEVSAEEAA